ncbi:hypothetical protein ANN_00110 [Periplaneta americana]|uniref:Uncharacterized protein n=1 Tax=Periplaneta americana TaxID=6978 RepID=A0ABQ8TPY2_PERAM|nr:hypothetical protein ANN_00110 [Periplaneta americana]
MAGLCEGGNEPPGSLKASNSYFHYEKDLKTEIKRMLRTAASDVQDTLLNRPKRRTMAKPNPIPDLKQRVKTLEGQVRLLLPLIEEVRVLKERLDSRSLHGLEARKEEEKVGSSNNIEELKEELKLRERELRETQAELEKLKEESEREKAELRQKYEGEHQLRLQQEKSYQDQLGKLRQELEAGREMRRQLEESKEEALQALREELQAKGEELKKMADELQAERQKTADRHRAAQLGDTHRVQLLLDAGSQVNAVDHDGRTPLWLAAREDHQDACRALLAAGVQLDEGATIWVHCSA